MKYLYQCVVNSFKFLKQGHRLFNSISHRIILYFYCQSFYKPHLNLQRYIIQPEIGELLHRHRSANNVPLSKFVIFPEHHTYVRHTALRVPVGQRLQQQAREPVLVRRETETEVYPGALH